jgi:hypothetical protein
MSALDAINGTTGSGVFERSSAEVVPCDGCGARVREFLHPDEPVFGFCAPCFEVLVAFHAAMLRRSGSAFACAVCGATNVELKGWTRASFEVCGACFDDARRAAQSHPRVDFCHQCHEIRPTELWFGESLGGICTDHV